IRTSGRSALPWSLAVAARRWSRPACNSARSDADISMPAGGTDLMAGWARAAAAIDEVSNVFMYVTILKVAALKIAGLKTADQPDGTAGMEKHGGLCGITGCSVRCGRCGDGNRKFRRRTRQQRLRF